MENGEGECMQIRPRRARCHVGQTTRRASFEDSHVSRQTGPSLIEPDLQELGTQINSLA